MHMVCSIMSERASGLMYKGFKKITKENHDRNKVLDVNVY